MYSSGVLNPQGPENRPTATSPQTSPAKERAPVLERSRGATTTPQEPARGHHSQNRAVTPPGRGDPNQSPRYAHSPQRGGTGAFDALDGGPRSPDDRAARSLSPEVGPRSRPVNSDIMTPRQKQRVLGEDLPSTPRSDAGPRVPPLRLGSSQAVDAGSPPNSARLAYTPRAESSERPQGPQGQDKRPRAKAPPAAKSGHAFGGSVARFPAPGSAAGGGTSPRQTGVSVSSASGSFRAPVRNSTGSGVLGSSRGPDVPAPATAKSWAGGSSAAPRRAVSPGRQSPGTDRGAGSSGGRWR